MDVKSCHEKPTWHGGEFHPELIRKSMFSYSCAEMSIEYNCVFFSLPPTFS